jgi:hypothetical protein
MDVHMEMAIDVGERQTSSGKTLELRLQLGSKLVLRDLAGEVAQANTRWPVDQKPPTVHEVRYPSRREHRSATRDDHMESHRQIWHRFREAYSLRGSRAPHHQAGARQHTCAMRLFHGSVHAGGAAEVVCVEDDLHGR